MTWPAHSGSEQLGAFARSLIAQRELVALGPELGDDALGIDQRLGATQADKSDLRCGRFRGMSFIGAHYRGEPRRRRVDRAGSAECP
jgi:hypothetical protein